MKLPLLALALLSTVASTTEAAPGSTSAIAPDAAVSSLAPGRRQGPGIVHTRVEAHSRDTYSIDFRGGETAVITVSGDGDTDLDLYVYDENGNLVADDTDFTDECIVAWTPAWSGEFTVVVKNLGSVYNAYTLATN